MTDISIAADTGASSNIDDNDKWNSIDWNIIENQVRRLQMRIAKATREKRFGKVRALQWLLTKSYNAKLLAIKRVTSNKGSRTPGIDGTTWPTGKKKLAAVSVLNKRGYKAQPLRRIYIPKKNGKRRPLGIPTIKDRAMQALHLLALEPVAETTSDPNSYGFRPKRSTQDAMQQGYIVLARKCSAEWILEADIKACFDKISHDWLIKNVTMDKKILQEWLNAGFIENQKLYPTDEGTPQGGIISPTLANIALNGLEMEIKNSSKRGEKVNMVRYADDFIVTAASKEILERIKVNIQSFLTERGLTLSEEKTKITSIYDGFNFLGFHFRKYKQKYMTKPAKENIKAIKAKVRETARANKSAATLDLINKLNPKLQGWGNYYRHVVSSKERSAIDHEVFKTVWKWAKRKHPQKSAGWIRNKYFRRKNLRSWIFHAKSYDKNGKPKIVDIVLLNKTPISRYVKIRAVANPYDPLYKEYFEERKNWKTKPTKYWNFNIAPTFFYG